MKRKPDYVSLSELKGIKILYENDFYELAKLVINIMNASDKLRGNVISRPTINGLSNHYSYILGSSYYIKSEDILNIVKNYGIQEGVAIDFDSNV